jgi:hypothetical protein
MHPNPCFGDTELSACLADDVTYCDPHGLIEGRPTLSNYMDGFQRAVPGGRFQIRSVLHHHNRTLAHWALHGPDGIVLQIGISIGLLCADPALKPTPD